MTRSPRIEDVSEVIWEPKLIRYELAYLSNCAKSQNSSYMVSLAELEGATFLHTRKIPLLRLSHKFGTGNFSQ